MASFKRFAQRISKAVGAFRNPRRGTSSSSIRSCEISHPTNFRIERASLQGCNYEELAVLREKELARRLGVMDPDSTAPDQQAHLGLMCPAGGLVLPSPVFAGLLGSATEAESHC